MAVVDFPVMPDSTWEISAVGIPPVSVVAPNWLVALGLAIHRMGEDALPGSMACEVLRSGSAVAHDFEHKRRYVVRRAGEQSFAESRTDPGISVIDTPRVSAPRHSAPPSTRSEPVYSPASAPAMTTETTAFEQTAPMEQVTHTPPTAIDPTAPMPRTHAIKPTAPMPRTHATPQVDPFESTNPPDLGGFEEPSAEPEETELFLPDLTPTRSLDMVDIEPLDDLFTFADEDAPVSLELAETEPFGADPGPAEEYPPGLEPEYPPGLEPENDIVVPRVAPILRPGVASRPLDPLFKKPLGAAEPEAPRSLFKKPFGAKKAS